LAFGVCGEIFAPERVVTDDPAEPGYRWAADTCALMMRRRSRRGERVLPHCRRCAGDFTARSPKVHRNLADGAVPAT